MARAHQLAALAIADHRRRRVAEHVLTACVTDERQLALLTDASLCHGLAGLVQIVRRAVAVAGPDNEPAARLAQLHGRLDHEPHRRPPPPATGCSTMCSFRQTVASW
ncbi:hypothetical protein AB0I60_37260 [Actinosynnema sp. NPDC050436]|uniref:hypothetical protein n=1 Tax=Actinosynnema sp. NPDC050436 TaxID=3155659 RepID=UPI0033E06927